MLKGTHAWLPVALVAVVTFFTALGSANLFDDDEPKNAECGREMFARGDWVVPTFNEELRTDKPILLYWEMLTAYHAFGVNEFAARFWSALLGVGTCLLTCGIGTRLFNAQVGRWAGIMLATCLMFTAIARAATPDSTLIFWQTLGVYLFLRFAWTGSVGNCSETLTTGLQQPRWYRRLPCYAALSVAVLAKGPVGVLLPCCVIGLFLYLNAAERLTGKCSSTADARPGWQQWCSRWLRPIVWLRTAFSMRPDLILACVAVIALPWYLTVGLQTDGAWLRGFWGDHNVGRFLQPMERHSGPIVYYPIAMLIGFFPWSVFLPLALLHAWRYQSQTERERSSLRFVACWLAVYVGFFSLARTKLPNYVLPCYPALALLTGFLFATRSWSIAGDERGWYRKCLVSLMISGGAMSIGLGVVAAVLLPTEPWLAAVGFVPVIGGWIARKQLQRDEGTRAVRSLTVTAVTFIVVVFSVIAPRISRYQDGPFLANAVQVHQSGLMSDVSDSSQIPEKQIGTLTFFPPGLTFYAQQRIERCHGAAGAAELLNRGGYVAMRADKLQELIDQLPADVVEVARRPRFLRQHEIVLLHRNQPPKLEWAGQSSPGDATANPVRVAADRPGAKQ